MRLKLQTGFARRVSHCLHTPVIEKSVAIEYDHLFMGGRNVNFTVLGINDRTDRIKQDVDMGTVRLNYTFGGPVVAKY